MKLHLVLLTLLFLFKQEKLFSQGLFDGFSKGKGNIDLALTGSYQSSQKYVTSKQSLIYPRSQAIVNIFGAYGFTDKWDFAGSIPFVFDRIQDITLGTKYAFLKKEKNSFSITSFGAFSVSVPSHNYPTEIKNAVGQRAVQLSPRFITQLHHSSGVFLQAQVGYQYAFTPVPSSTQYSVKGGWHGNHVYVDAWFDQQIGQGDKDFLGTVPYTSFREFNFSYQRIGTTLYYGVNNWGVSLAYSGVLTVRNGWLFQSISAGLIRKFKV